MRKLITAVIPVIVILICILTRSGLPDDRHNNEANNTGSNDSINSGISDLGSVNKNEKPYNNEEIISCKYFTEKDFRASVYRADAPKPSLDSISAGIVPHHLLACDMIAGFFKTVSAYSPEIVVVLAPNHKRSGNTSLSTGYWSWQTAFGQVDADNGLVRYLIDSRDAGTSFELLEEDHSISALVPYIKYYMPTAKIVPVMLFGNYGPEASKKLGNSLADQLKGKKSLVIASIDFSHYLPPEKAEMMDKATIEAIKAMDIEALSRMGNDNLDSPPSIMTLISYIKSIGAPKPILLEHSNSSIITGRWSNSTTSYFTIVY